MIGEPTQPNKYGRLLLREGAYGQDLRGIWWVRPPGGDAYKLSPENVTEHEDGTISVSVQINGRGYRLEHGVWRKP